MLAQCTLNTLNPALAYNGNEHVSKERTPVHQPIGVGNENKEATKVRKKKGQQKLKKNSKNGRKFCPVSPLGEKKNVMARDASRTELKFGLVYLSVHV